jgi:hypothetical protein
VVERELGGATAWELSGERQCQRFVGQSHRRRTALTCYLTRLSRRRLRVGLPSRRERPPPPCWRSLDQRRRLPISWPPPRTRLPHFALDSTAKTWERPPGEVAVVVDQPRRPRRTGTPGVPPPHLVAPLGVDGGCFPISPTRLRSRPALRA